MVEDGFQNLFTIFLFIPMKFESLRNLPPNAADHLPPPNRSRSVHPDPQAGGGQVERLVYARQGREFMGCKSPVGGSPS